MISSHCQTSRCGIEDKRLNGGAPLLKYRCLIVDHDDTVVNSTATVHYPCFVQYCAEFFPDYTCTLEHYFLKNFDPGVVAFFGKEVGMTHEQMMHEQTYWNEYVQHHIPKAYPGMRDILLRQKAEGGILCVISHSYRDNILRDYRENDLPEPDMIFGWECPPDRRKPNSWPLEQIMETFHLQPEEMLVLDDLKPGYDMARKVHVPFAAAGWANDIPEIESFMRNNCDLYFKTITDLNQWLFSEEEKKQ